MRGIRKSCKKIKRMDCESFTDTNESVSDICPRKCDDCYKFSTAPSLSSSSSPSLAPSAAPGQSPSEAPSFAQSRGPPASPSLAPTPTPTIASSSKPSASPSADPNQEPTIMNPSTVSPSLIVTTLITQSRTISPTDLSSSIPSAMPSFVPTEIQTEFPTSVPSIKPSQQTNNDWEIPPSDVHMNIVLEKGEKTEEQVEEIVNNLAQSLESLHQTTRALSSSNKIRVEPVFSIINCSEIGDEHINVNNLCLKIVFRIYMPTGSTTSPESVVDAVETSVLNGNLAKKL